MRDKFLTCVLLISFGCADPSAPWEGSGATIVRNARGAIVGINLTDTAAADIHLAQLASLPHLTTLTLGASVNDADLVHLKSLVQLQRLYLKDTQVTAAGLMHVSALRLRQLDLPTRARTDVGLKYLMSAMEPADALDLTGWQVSDPGLNVLRQWPELRQLSLKNTAVGLHQLGCLQEE